MIELQPIEGRADFRASKSEPVSQAQRALFQALDARDTRRRDQAWAQIQKLLEPAVRAVINAHIRVQKEIVDEIVQETFLAAIASIDSFDPNVGGSFAAWVKKIAERRAVDYLRDEFGRRGIKSKVSFEDLARSRDVRGILEERETPEVLLLRAWAAPDVRRTIIGLNQRQREVVLLRYAFGLTGAQVGKILRVSEARISQISKEALRRLRIRGQYARHTSMMPKDKYDALIASLQDRAESTLGQDLKEAT